MFCINPTVKRIIIAFPFNIQFITFSLSHIFYTKFCLICLFAFFIYIFSRNTIILRNFIPHETAICEDIDPPWFNKAIKSIIQEKKAYLESIAKAIITSSYYSAKDLFKLNSFVNVSKQNCYCQMSTKLTKFHKSLKAYWSLLKTFLNNKK